MDKKDTCGSIMIANPTTLAPDCSLLEALRTIRACSVRYLPVVDAEQNFVGIFSSLTLLSVLLPQSMNINMGRRPPELKFMRPTVGELTERLGVLADEPILDYIIRDDISVCHPDSSIMAAIHLLNEHHAHVIVTEKDSKRFLGIITINGLLDHITQQA